MSRVLRIVAVALGLTTILLAPRIEPLVKSTHDLAYHWTGRPLTLFGPTVVDELVWWAALILLLLSAERLGRWRIAVWGGILIFLPWIVSQSVSALWPSPMRSWIHVPSILYAVVAWVLVVLLWRRSFTKRSEAVIGFLSTVLAFVAISGALFTTQLVWFWWGARTLNDPLPMHQERPAEAAVNDSHARVIWIVLDELSYSQVYEHRYPGLQLPTFDALAADSVVFAHAVPAGSRTEKVLPALMTGEPVDDVRSSASGQLSIHNSAIGKWQRFDEHNTVFQDALNDGYETAVAGWYNPYCRILPGVLDHCYWTFDETTNDGGGPNASFGSNLIASASSTVGNGLPHRVLCKVLRRPERDTVNLQLQISDYQRLRDAGDQLLADRKDGFVLLHLPVPHPRGIYDRATGRLSAAHTSYVDNLALADVYLAHVRSLLEQTGQWDTSTIVVMGDHSWRTYSWITEPGWTAEDERASEGGKFDPRPFYMVKLAGEHEGARIDAPFRALETRGLMDALLAGKLRTVDDLRGWVESTGGAKTGAPSEAMAK